MRVRARKDENHTEIVSVLRDMGASVLDTAQLGNGAPDIIVGVRGQNFLIEIKDGKKPPSKRKLTPDEKAFMAAWKGSYYVIQNVQEAIDLVNNVYKQPPLNH